MTCFELHLNVNQRLQEVASFKRDKFRPEEIDLALNKAMDRLILEAVENDFQGTQINLSHVTGLIKKTKPLDVIIPGASDPVVEDNINSVYSTIPPDFYYLVNGRVEIVEDPLNCSTAPALSTTSFAEWKAVVPFPTSSTAPHFANFAINSSLGNLYTTPTALTAGFQNSRSQYVLVNDVLQKLARSNNVRVYWERYRDTYYNNSFIFVGNSNLGTIAISATGVTTTSQLMSSTAYSTYNRALIPNLTSHKEKIVPIKVTKENLLYSSLKQNSYYDSGKDEVITDQILDYLIFYGKESFIITRAYIDYIRKPRVISLLLGQTCELADSVHNKVVDLAVEILRLDTKDQAYPQTVQDTQLRTI